MRTRNDFASILGNLQKYIKLKLCAVKNESTKSIYTYLNLFGNEIGNDHSFNIQLPPNVPELELQPTHLD